jgi:class 3 adenylate cyclase/CHASE2 domain-containing sensor protein
VSLSPEGEKGEKRVFDPVRMPWFFPLLVLGFIAPIRLFAPAVAEKPELFWLDEALRARVALDLAEPLDPAIHFVELSMNDEIASRFAEDGEYATAAAVLRTLASLGPRVIAVDIIYAHGRAADQAELARAVREIEAGGRTRVVLSLSTEHGGRIERSLPLADGEKYLQGVVNVTAARNWREYRMVHRVKEESLPSLALAAFSATRAGPLAPKEIKPGQFEWKTIGPEGKAVSAAADDSRVFLNLPHSYFEDRFDRRAGIEERFWTIAELETRASRGEETLRDATVFLGFDVELDGRPTTHSAREPGMFIHGTALNDLLHDRSIRPAGRVADLTLYGLVALLAAATFSLVKRKRWLIVIAIAGIVILLLGGWLAVWYLHLLPGALNAAMLWGGAVLLEIGRRWTVEQRERTHRDAMLGFYFSPAVLKQVIQNLDMIRPQENEVAVLLSDLRGFTTLCETQPVERVFALLNRLFAIETDAALIEDGSLARFAGDQFLAYWGAPEPCRDPADRALRAALGIQRALNERREAPEADDLDGWLRIGIGLHRGRGLVGHVGSRSYRDYNLVGDSVNTTARVESQSKNYAAEVLASGEFIADLSFFPAHLLVDRVTVKGKALATELHAVFDEYPADLAIGCERYRAAFAHYAAGGFGTATASFDELADHSHETIATSARLLAARCRDLAANPPLEWDGVFELTSK